MSAVTGRHPDGDPPDRIGPYVVLRRLGEGGQGVVYLARSPSGQACAVKVLRVGWTSDPEARRRLAREVAAATKVAPFCTAQVIEARVDDDLPYIVTEFVEGPTLAAHVQRTGPLRNGDLHRVAIGTTTALVAIHAAQVVHRDLKPSNVILGPLGPRVIDFGIARHLSPTTTTTHLVVGTPHYMAPEQYRGEEIGPAADMFAWACTIAYAATGRAAFGADHVAAVAARITKGTPDLDGIEAPLGDILQRCLAKNPADRPTASATLLALLGGSPTTLESDPTPLLTQALAVTLPTVERDGTVPAALTSPAAAAPTPPPPTPSPSPAPAPAAASAPTRPPGPAAPHPLAVPFTAAPQALPAAPAFPAAQAPAAQRPSAPATSYSSAPHAPTPAPVPQRPAAPAPFPATQRPPAPAPAVRRPPTPAPQRPAAPAPFPTAQRPPAPAPAPAVQRPLAMPQAARPPVAMAPAMTSSAALPPVNATHPVEAPARGERRIGSRLVGVLLIAAALALTAGLVLERDAISAALQPVGGTTATGTGSSGNGSGSSGAGATAAAQGSPVVPDRFAGTWRGQLYGPAGYNTDVVITLHAGQSTGRVEYPAAECAGKVWVVAVGSGESSLLLEESIDTDPNSHCPTGQVTLLPAGGPAALTYRWVDRVEADKVEEGTVRRGPTASP